MNKKEHPSLGSTESSGEVDAHTNHHKAMSKCSMIRVCISWEEITGKEQLAQPTVDGWSSSMEDVTLYRSLEQCHSISGTYLLPAQDKRGIEIEK